MSPSEKNFGFGAIPSDPLDRDFDLYELYLLGIVSQPPEVPANLDDEARDLLYRKRAILEWKYEDGLQEAADRHPESYPAVRWIRSLPEVGENEE